MSVEGARLDTVEQSIRDDRVGTVAVLCSPTKMAGETEYPVRQQIGTARITASNDAGVVLLVGSMEWNRLVAVAALDIGDHAERD